MAGWLLRGVGLPDGDPVEAGITADGRWVSTPAIDAELLPGRFVLPGLVDAHCHLSVAHGEDGWPAAVNPATMRAHLAGARAAGVTGIRDTGSPGSISLELVGTAEGAGLVACGRFLAPQDRYFPALHVPVPAEQLVDAALAEVRAGAGWVKIIADSPLFGADRPLQPPSPTYPLQDIRGLVDAVHAAGARVAAHTTTRYATELIEAGIDSVEHGIALDETDLDKLAASGGGWTPTLCAALAIKPDDDPDRRRRQLELRDRLRHLLPAAVNRGVTLMTGTDVVGTIPREVALLTELGLPPHTALAAASTSARKFLGFHNLRRDGEHADLVTYDHDPRDDPQVLARPAAVFLAGTRLR